MTRRPWDEQSIEHLEGSLELWKTIFRNIWRGFRWLFGLPAPPPDN